MSDLEKYAKAIDLMDRAGDIIESSGMVTDKKEKFHSSLNESSEIVNQEIKDIAENLCGTE